jgi:phytoene dehydrogenase-like protein
VLGAFHEAAGEALLHGPLAPAPRFFVEHTGATFGSLLDAHLRDPLLKAVLAAHGGNYALPPGRASALVGLAILDHYLGGAYFPLGGSAAIRDAFAGAIARRGGSLSAGRAVARILTRGGRISGVRCHDGETFEAPAVISAADAALTYLDLLAPADLPPRARDRAARARPSLGCLNLFLGTTRDPEAAGMTDANVWHFAGIDLDHLYEPLFRGSLPEVDSFFLSSPSLKDPAPRALHTLVLSTIVPYEPFAPWSGTRAGRRGAEYRELKRTLLDRYLAGVERYAPGVTEGAEVIELSTPLTNESFTGARRGGTYGPEHTPDQMGPLRFPIRGPIPGLYLCGQSTLGCGIVTSALSGLHAGALASGGSRTDGLAPGAAPEW